MTKKMEIYCGINDLKKGQKYGSMLECAKKKQVRRYGVNKADSRVLKAYLNKEGPRDRGKIIVEYAGVKGMVNKLTKDKAKEKDTDKLKAIDDKLLVYKDKLRILGVELRESNKREMENDSDSEEEEAPVETFKLTKKQIDDIIENQQKLTNSMSNENKLMREKIDKLKPKSKPKPKPKPKNKKKGGKLQVSVLKKFIEESHKESYNDVGNFKIDRELSHEWVKVYYNKALNQCVVVHRGSKDLDDAIVDGKLLFQQMNNKRFKISEQVQKKAIQKYGKDNITTVGSSLGGYLAEKYGNSGGKEVITVSKPTTPYDIARGKKKGKYQYDIRNSLDAIASGQNLQKGPNDIVISGSVSDGPLKSHMGPDVLAKLDQDRWVGRALPSLDSILKKMKVSDLKLLVKLLKSSKSGGSRQYPITGKNKGDLIKMVMSLKGGAMSGGEQSLWEKLNVMFTHNIAVPLFKHLMKMDKKGGSRELEMIENLPGLDALMKKMKVSDLKGLVKLLRGMKRGRARQYPLTGATKQDLMNMVHKLKGPNLTGGKLTGGKEQTLWEKLNVMFTHNVAVPLFKQLMKL